MKRKLIKYLFLGLTVLTLAGCGSIVDDSLADRDEYDIEEDVEDEDEEDEDDGEVKPEEKSSEEKVLLSRDSTSEIFYVVDESGENIDQYTRQELSENISASDSRLYRVNAEEQYLQSALACEGDGFFFFKDSNYSDESGEYIYLVYAVSGDDHKLYPIWEDRENHYIEACDYYDGCLYVDYNLGYDYDSDKTLGVKEVCYEYDPSSDSFVEKESEYASVIEEINSKGIRILGSRCAGWDNVDCYTRDFKECGYILGSTGSGYAVINEKGISLDIEGTENVYISFFAPGYLFYDDSNYDTGRANVYVYDIAAGSAKTIASDVESTVFLGRDGSKMYYLTGSYEEYGIAHNRIYSYNTENGANDLVYEAKSVPGVSLAYPGAEGFRVADDRIYMIDFKDGDLKWFCADVSDGNADFKDISCPEQHVDLFDYGTVEYASYSYACPKCGTILNQRYAECFVLDDKYSENADVINQYMHENLEAFVGDNFLESSDYYETECADHQANPTWYRVTDDWNVSSVGFIDDKYLTVEMSGYWYGGGAHGYPSRNQYLFDIETGEEKSIGDFYTGTEKDFKTLVAEKTRDYFLSLDQYENPFYTDDEDIIYSDAYDNVYLDDGNIEYLYNGIIYYYPPYLMGPYATGYIDIFIPYSELLGRANL
ncbi:MAG: RsiV family protein [Lachnospiraceae bacterium]|nr:RsiV family protein [Lachnospiraceae bacterium]